MIKPIDKPTPKREVAVTFSTKDARIISFYATADAVTEFESYGYIEPSTTFPNRYNLIIDARYDFDEVLAFIEAYG